MMKPLCLLLLLILSVLLTQLQGRKYFTALTSARGKNKSRKYEKILLEPVMSYATRIEATAGACAISCLKEEGGSCKGFQFIEDLEHGGQCNLINFNSSKLDKSGSEAFYIGSKILLFSSGYIIISFYIT